MSRPQPRPPERVSGVVLREHGNVCSATILFILDWLPRNAEAGLLENQ